MSVRPGHLRVLFFPHQLIIFLNFHLETHPNIHSYFGEKNGALPNKISPSKSVSLRMSTLDDSVSIRWLYFGL
jgi:hypothetical protein